MKKHKTLSEELSLKPVYEILTENKKLELTIC